MEYDWWLTNGRPAAFRVTHPLNGISNSAHRLVTVKRPGYPMRYRICKGTDKAEMRYPLYHHYTRPCLGN